MLSDDYVQLTNLRNTEEAMQRSSISVWDLPRLGLALQGHNEAILLGQRLKTTTSLSSWSMFIAKKKLK